MKILNLDKLATAHQGRELIMGGIAYPVVPMSVNNFVETTNAIDRLSQGNASPAEQIIATVDMICRSVPTLPRDGLQNYPLETLTPIAAFVRGEDVAEQELLDNGQRAGQAATLADETNAGNPAGK